MATTKIGYIYILQTDSEEFCKIGRARHVMARIRRMSPQLPWKCNLIYWKKVDDAVAAEAHIHEVLREWRVNGEWFAVTKKHALFVAYGLFGDCPVKVRIDRKAVWEHDFLTQTRSYLGGLA